MHVSYTLCFGDLLFVQALPSTWTLLCGVLSLALFSWQSSSWMIGFYIFSSFTSGHVILLNEKANQCLGSPKSLRQRSTCILTLYSCAYFCSQMVPNLMNNLNAMATYSSNGQQTLLPPTTVKGFWDHQRRQLGDGYPAGRQRAGYCLRTLPWKMGKDVFLTCAQPLSTVLEKFQDFSLWRRKKLWLNTHMLYIFQEFLKRFFLLQFPSPMAEWVGTGASSREVQAMNDEPERKGERKWKLESG